MAQTKQPLLDSREGPADVPTERKQPGPPSATRAQAGKVGSRLRSLVAVVHAGPLLLVAVAVLWVLPASNYWIFTVTVGLILGISCLGLMVVVGWSREISLMQAGLTGMSLYISGYYYRAADGVGLPFPVAATLGVLSVMALGLLVAAAAVRLSGVYVMVLTLSVQFLIEKTFFTSGKLTGGLSAPSTPRPGFFGLEVTSDRAFYYYTLATLAVVVVFLQRFRNSRFGRSLVTVGWDRQAAAAVGISPFRYKLLAFGVSGLLAGVAGVLSAPLYGNPPGPLQYSSFNSLFYLAIPVLAGFESIIGVVLVAVVFVVVPQALEKYHISAFLLGGLGLAAGVLVGPRGVSGAVSDLAARVSRQRAAEPVAPPLHAKPGITGALATEGSSPS